MGIIHVAGLGPGSLDGLAAPVLRLLTSGLPVYLRTERHPVVDGLRGLGVGFEALDRFYEESDEMGQVYEAMAEYLLRQADTGAEIVFAVPGHPGVAEKTVRILMEKGPRQGHLVRQGGGRSFLDDALSLLGVDPVEGLAVIDASSVGGQALAPSLHTLVVQMDSRALASEVKLTLAEVYGDEWEVAVVQAAGVPGRETVRRCLLCELDRLEEIDHLTTVYVPPLGESDRALGEWHRLLGIVAELRSDHGCPWDLEQTHASLRPYVLEEAYEVAHAIGTGDLDHLAEELGDLLLQIVLHSQIASEEGAFDAREVVRRLSLKLIRRHPHVFGGASAKTAEEVRRRWEDIKAQEREARGESRTESALDGVSQALSPWRESLKLQRKAAELGFDWPDSEGPLAKAREELEEFRTARGPREQRAELGDLLFVLANLAGQLDIDPEDALRAANQKFRCRFRAMERLMEERGIPLKGSELDLLDEFWQNAKESGGC